MMVRLVSTITLLIALQKPLGVAECAGQKQHETLLSMIMLSSIPVGLKGKKQNLFPSQPKEL